MTRTHKALNTGVSFIEIAFAVLCLGVLLVPVSSIFTQGSTNTIRNRNEVLAQQHAANLMNCALLIPYDDLVVGSAIDYKTLNLNVSGGQIDLSVEEELFSRHMTVTEETSPSWKYSYKLITVNVSWQEPSGIERNISIAGLVSK